MASTSDPSEPDIAGGASGGVEAAQLSAEVAIVEEFLGALERFDMDAAVELMHPDIEYRNVPFPPALGRPTVEKQMRGLDRMFTGFEARIHHIAANGPVVLTERTDVLERNSVRAEFWVCGTFEIRDGRVRVWRDRFDLVDVTWAMLNGVVAAPLRRGGSPRR